MNNKYRLLRSILLSNFSRLRYPYNERIFKEAIKKSGYKEYFLDMFAGDFGHCTLKGNKLLAENIADVIRK